MGKRKGTTARKRAAKKTTRTRTARKPSGDMEQRTAPSEPQGDGDMGGASVTREQCDGARTRGEA